MLDILARRDLAAGLVAGAVALAGGVAIARRRRPVARPVPLGGLLVVAAFLIGLALARRVPAGLVAGPSILVLAGVPVLLGSRGGRIVAIPLVLAGAASIALWGGLPSRTWLRVVALVAVPAVAWLLRDFELHPGRRGIGLLLLTVSAAGLFGTLPNTEQALVLLGVTVPIAFLGWPRPLATLGPGWAPAVAAIYVWTVAFGGSPRAGSVIGGLGCLGLLAAEPLGRALRGSEHGPLDRLPRRWWAGPGVAVVHGALVLVNSRVAGLRRSGVEAGLITVGTLLAVVLVCWALSRERTRP